MLFTLDHDESERRKNEMEDVLEVQPSDGVTDQRIPDGLVKKVVLFFLIPRFIYSFHY